MNADKTRRPLTHEFVEFIPEQLQEGVLYVSTTYATAAHRCFCGCGHEVITPLSPTDWELSFDGETVSLWPSIGNWGSPCRSHYWVKNNRVEWSSDMPDTLIEAGRVADRGAKANYYRTRRSEDSTDDQLATTISGIATAKQGGDPRSETLPQKRVGLFNRLVGWVRGK